MTIRMKYRPIVQYSLIYFMLIINQSQLYKMYIQQYNYFLVVLAACLLVFIRRSSKQYTTLFLLILLDSILFVRIFVGGIGLSAWANWAIKILAALLAVIYDRDKFIIRYIRTVVILAIISIIGFSIQMIAPNILKSFLMCYNSSWHYNVWLSSNSYRTYSFKGYGLFLYTFIDNGNMRNIGIFTEPGVYQMVLNSAILLLLFFCDKVSISSKRRIQYFLILMLTIILCQSTTGYIGFVGNILVLYLLRQKNYKELRASVLSLVAAVVMFLVIDLIVRGNGSMIYSVVISKISKSGSIDLNVSTGRYRLGTIYICIKTILEHPLGVGADGLQIILNTIQTGYVAASILTIGAMLGIIPFIFILTWLFYPIIVSHESISIKILIVFLYFNTALAQSSPFYPSLVIIPILFQTYRFNIMQMRRGGFRDDKFYNSLLQ
ncbi:hypothetical protein [Clostridium oryzae]|uniref:O-antigen ligase n=1 Tax=Clostridium oryzae TaxID=1450648 RepID=A0A1V4IS40_9CLOT|nr:hypothetical protein [Clostridium oryzae]OPJ62709.1 hypothetical protein CLORY_15890 [Clostridium oryzae]